MTNELDPRIDQWYSHLDKGQRFYVVDINEEEEAIELQYFDADLTEISFDEWQELEIELSEEPENFSGALDFAEQDDLGTEITDTEFEDWAEPGEDFPRPDE